MVTEFAEIDVKPGLEEAFIAGVAASKPLFLAFAACHGLELHRSIEAPGHFVLNIKWDDVAAHEAFRASPDFQTWRGHVGHTFAAPPKVWHSHTVG
jgi:quinol monooxygenase YgiN